MDPQYYHTHLLLPTNTSTTSQRGRKRQADLEDLRQPNAPQDPPPRPILAMITAIPQSIWYYGASVVNRFIGLFKRDDPALRPPPAGTPTRIHAVPTDFSGRKRRAVDTTVLAYPPQLGRPLDHPLDHPLEQDADAMLIDTPPQPEQEHVPAPLPTSFNKRNDTRNLQRQNWYKGYFQEGDFERKTRLHQPLQPQTPRTQRKKEPLRDSQINGLISKAHRAQGGSFAQKAAQRIAEEKAAREAAEREAAEKRAAEEAAQEAARVEAEREEARIRAEAEAAARAQNIIVDLPGYVIDKMRDTLSGPQQDREEIVQLGSFPIQKLSFKRILASDKGTDSWLDDDAVNAWYHAITEAKNRQTGYVKKDGNVPAISMLNTGWWAKATKDGATSLKRWTKRAGIGGTNLLKCERFFLPINMGSHWTLLIINGTDRSIEYLDSLGGDGKYQFQIARDLLKSELGSDYHAQEWTDLKRNRSSMQDNMSDCGVFTCFNGLAAAKERPYKEVTAKQMPLARSMLAGVLMNGGFEGEFDL